MVKLASCVGSDWLEDTDAEALADVTLNHFLGHQLGPDSEPLPDVGILGDHLSALIEQQRRSCWDESSRSSTSSTLARSARRLVQTRPGEAGESA